MIIKCLPIYICFIGYFINCYFSYWFFSNNFLNERTIAFFVVKLLIISPNILYHYFNNPLSFSNISISVFFVLSLIIFTNPFSNTDKLASSKLFLSRA